MIRRFALLQTFVAVARAGKMKQAAHELALTPGAVSQRIRQLEEAAGRRLFSRTSSGVELSAAGEAMFAALAEPFRAIEAVDRELGGPSSSRVTMSTTPSFAATWLVPRLAMFAQRYPDIEIAVETGHPPGRSEARADRFGHSAWVGKVSWLESHLARCSRTHRRREPRSAQKPWPPQDAGRLPGISSAPRLQPPGLAALVRSPWRQPRPRRKGPAFSENHLIVRAAVAGQGLALVRDIYADDDLRSTAAGKGAYGELACCNSRIMRSRQPRRCKSPRFDGSGLVGRRGATGDLTTDSSRRS